MSILMNWKEAGLGLLGRALQAPPLGRSLVAGADKVRLRKRPFPHLVANPSPKFQILVYHRVLPERDPFAISPVSVRDFDSQMGLLKKHYRVIGLDRLVDELDAGRLEPGTVCVTFDDGYKDNHDHAWPILRKHDIPATIYLATGFTATEECPWYDKVLAAMRDATAARLPMGPPGVEGAELRGPLERAQLAYRLLEWLKGFGPAERDSRVLDLERGLGAARRQASRTMLDWDEVRRMHGGGGVTFGAHTVTHPILSTIGEEEMDREIAGSRSAIEEALQAPVRHFAYPNGRAIDYNPAAVRILARQGFKTAVTTINGVNGPDRSRLELMRRQPWEANPHSLHFRMLMERLAA